MLAPTGRDAKLAVQALMQARLSACSFSSVEALCEAAAENAGALLLTDEALDHHALQCLFDLIGQQPPWSDLPLLLLVSSETSAENLLQCFGSRANVTILERPIHLSTFLSAANAAINARRRQYQIRTLLEELEKANRLKDEFLATLSHELRNPLNSIIGNAVILLRNPQVQAFSLVRQAAKTIERNAASQARLINDLLDLSRLQTGKVKLDRQILALAPLLDGTLDSVREIACVRNIALEVRLGHEPLLVEADSVRVEQIVWNLLNNALKFTPEGGKVRLILERDQSQARVTVEDNGQGIESEFLPHIFEMFRQQDGQTTKQHGGLGIGLALVKQLTELHGGRVEAESAGTGQGARISVWLPLYLDQFRADKAATLLTDSAKLTDLQILAVDDTPDSVEMLRVLLEMEGAQVVMAMSGAEALRKTAEADFDVIISDVSMPSMDGYELMERLRHEPRTAHTPAIALTGFGRPEDEAQARAVGFNAHLTKPIDFDRLIRLILDATG